MTPPPTAAERTRNRAEARRAAIAADVAAVLTDAPLDLDGVWHRLRVRIERPALALVLETMAAAGQIERVDAEGGPLWALAPPLRDRSTRP